jgi:hypothetical protein
VASDMARYSALVLDREITCCFLANQEIRLEPKKIPKPVVEHRSSGLPVQLNLQ